MMLSCDAGTACSLVLLQVSTATAGTKTQGHPTRATPTTSNSTHPTETMATSGQPTRAGRSQAVADVGMVGGGARESMVSTKEMGRDRKRPDSDGNFNINRSSHVTGPSPVGNTAVTEQSGSRNPTPSQGQDQTQSSKAQQDKPFSYAQALKTKSSPYSKPLSSAEGGLYRASSSKLSSRSQTPSESSLLGGKDGMMMKGAPSSQAGGGNHASIDDSLDFELRSSSALSITTATDSVTSERSASRQSLSLDVSAQRGEEGCGMKAAFDTRTEKSDYDDSEGITFMGPQLDYEQVERSPIAAPPVLTADPSTPTNQFRAPSPAARSSSPITTTSTGVTINHPSAAEYAHRHPGQRSIPPTQEPLPQQQSPSVHNQEDRATTFIERRGPIHSPSALSPVPPPGTISPNKEHPYKSPGTSPQHPSVAEEATRTQAGVFQALQQQLEQTPPPAPSGLGDSQTDSSEKSRQQLQADKTAAILLSPPSQKHPPAAPDVDKDGVQSLMLSSLPGSQQPQHQDVSGGGAGVLPNPVAATPAHMTSILPHPPTIATPPQQTHLPLRPPGQSEN